MPTVLKAKIMGLAPDQLRNACDRLEKCFQWFGGEDRGLDWGTAEKHMHRPLKSAR